MQSSGNRIWSHLDCNLPPLQIYVIYWQKIDLNKILCYVHTDRHRLRLSTQILTGKPFDAMRKRSHCTESEWLYWVLHLFYHSVSINVNAPLCTIIQIYRNISCMHVLQCWTTSVTELAASMQLNYFRQFHLPHIRHHLQSKTLAQTETSSACRKPESYSALKWMGKIMIILI